MSEGKGTNEKDKNLGEEHYAKGYVSVGGLILQNGVYVNIKVENRQRILF